MISRLKQILGRLRGTFSGKAEDAYQERDDAKEGTRAEAYAAGEAHAYGVAVDEVRDVEKRGDE